MEAVGAFTCRELMASLGPLELPPLFASRRRRRRSVVVPFDSGLRHKPVWSWLLLLFLILGFPLGSGVLLFLHNDGDDDNDDNNNGEQQHRHCCNFEFKISTTSAVFGTLLAFEEVSVCVCPDDKGGCQ